MSCYLGKLIARYNSARDAMKSLLDSDQELSDNQITEADQELDAAFKAIMQAEIEDALQAQARIRFITELINERCEDREFIQRLTDKILEDVSGITRKPEPGNNAVPQTG